MKQKLYTFTERLLIAAFALIVGTAIAIGVSATEVSNLPDMDVDGNGTVNVADAVLLARVIAEDPTVKDFNNIDINNDGLITSDDLTVILRYLVGFEDFIPHGSTTDTTTTTTGTTTEGTNTTQTTVTTQTTSAIETTTVSANNRITHYLLDASDGGKTVTYVSEVYKESMGYWFFTDSDGKVWCYSFLYSNEYEKLTPDQLIHQPELIEGLHIWEPDDRLLWVYLTYTDYMDDYPQFDSPLPDTTNASFVGTDGTNHAYNLVSWNQFDYYAMENITKILDNEKEVADSDVEQFDYNLNGSIDEEDFLIGATYYHAYLPSTMGVSAIPAPYSMNNWEYFPSTGEYVVTIG